MLAFAAGGAVFFGLVFGAALWQTRPRRDPELDMLLHELTLENAPAGRHRAAWIGGMRRVARTYIVLGILVTALGLSAVVQEGLEQGSARSTLIAMVVIVVVWALAIPFVIALALRTSRETLEPLGLTQRGAVLVGERHGREVRVDITAEGSVTRLESDAEVGEMDGDAAAAHAGRGTADTWRGVTVESSGGKIVIRRSGHPGSAWLWDLWLAERLIGDREPESGGAKDAGGEAASWP